MGHFLSWSFSVYSQTPFSPILWLSPFSLIWLSPFSLIWLSPFSLMWLSPFSLILAVSLLPNFLAVSLLPEFSGCIPSPWVFGLSPFPLILAVSLLLNCFGFLPFPYSIWCQCRIIRTKLIIYIKMIFQDANFEYQGVYRSSGVWFTSDLPHPLCALKRFFLFSSGGIMH